MGLELDGASARADQFFLAVHAVRQSTNGKLRS
jgi:hypothetical protein